MQPSVSVILPVFNGAAPGSHFKLWLAVESILSQTHGDLELILINDGSTDGTSEVLRGFRERDERVSLIELEANLGIGGALNRAISVAKGAFVARMDADDLSRFDRIARQHDFLTRHPDVGIVGSGMWVLDQNDLIMMEVIRPSSHEDILRFAIHYGCPFVHGSVMIRRSILEQTGGYADRSMWASEDFELWFRILSVTRGANIAEPLYFFRHSSSGLGGRNAKRIAADTEKIVAKFREKFADTLRLSESG